LPTLHLIGGPNGAGKSTISNFLPRYKRIVRFDPDEYISELNNKGITDQQDQLYSIKLKVEQFFENRESFSFESNLQNAESYSIIKLAKQNRYKIELTFISVDDINLLYGQSRRKSSTR